MSNNLNIDQVADGQAHPEVTVNNATGQLDAAITDTLTVDGTADSTVTDTNWSRHVQLFVNNVTNAARQVTVPAIKKFMLIKSDTANTTLFSVKCGTTLISILPGEVAVIFADGTANGLKSFGGGIPPLSQFVPGTVTASAIVFQHIAGEALSLPASLPGSYAKAGVASTGTVTYDVQKNGASIGSVVFTTSATATFTFATTTALAAGDRLTIVAPGGAPDATLKDVTFSIRAVRAV